ncbi:MAG TPA: hypothetical protein VM695_14795 [Phycisphaerae bacterium]|nr:hypothetical protein [Phycisphaerae bacterium]
MSRNETKRPPKRWGPAAACVLLLAATLQAAAPKAPAVDWGNVPAHQAGLFVSGEGLTARSPKEYWLHTPAGRRVRACAIGRAEAVPPGQYELRVGFPSGWVGRRIELKAGDRHVVSTGLFTFRQVTPPDWPSTVIQQLYAGDDYLIGGYQGATARLLPGRYTVLHQDPARPKASDGFSTWHVAGPFGGRSNRGRMDAPFAPEAESTHDPNGTYADGQVTLAWRKLVGAPEVDLLEAVDGSGVAYAFSVLETDAEATVRLTLESRGPVKAWLNGRAICDESKRPSWSRRRLSVIAAFRKGRNELFLKTLLGREESAISASVTYYSRYDVEVAANGALEPSPAGAQGPAGPGPTHGHPDDPPAILFCQVPDAPDGSCEYAPGQFFFPRRPGNARLCSLAPAAPNGRLRNLTPEFAAAIHPTISYDGTRVLFAGREGPRGRWDIWEMNVDGSGKRQITRDLSDCLNPCYLPDGRILFCSGKGEARDEYDKEVAKHLFICQADGSDPEQISFNLSSESFPTVLQDGRVLFTSWQHQGNHMGEAGVFALFTCNPDGTVAMPFYGNQSGEGGAVKAFAQQLPDGRVLCVEVAGRNAYGLGALATFDLANPLRTFQLISGGRINYTEDYYEGRFTTPWPLPDGRMLCSFTPGRHITPFRKDHPREDPHLGIYWFDLAAGQAGRLVFDDPHAQDLWPLAVQPRPAPPVIPSLVQPGRRTGTLLCVNPYLSDRGASQSVTVGRLPPARPGEIKAVRVVEGFGNIDMDPRRHAAFVTVMGLAGHGTSNTASSFEQKRIVGTAPVEGDGSFHVEVPADTTLHLQLLDGNGMAIETQLTWIWVRPGEARFCVGCHESRQTGLPNLDCQAMRRARPHFLAPPPEQRRTVDFRRDLMPVINAKCATPKCHGADPPTGGLGLGGGLELVFHREGRNAAYFNRAYESLLANIGGRSLTGRLVEPGTARHSPLIWRLHDRQLGISDPHVNYKWPGKPKQHKAVLTDAERTLFAEWVDLGAQWDNLPGEDEYPGYDRDQNRRLAQAARDQAAKPVADPRRAYETRCWDCHSDLYMQQARPTKTPADWDKTLRQMDGKRPGWIRPSELPLLREHIRKHYLVAGDGEPTPQR